MYDHLHKPFIVTYGKPFVNYAQMLEQAAADQMSEVMRHDWVIQGALMADAHSGFTLPIGGVVACDNMISPAFVGVN